MVDWGVLFLFLLFVRLYLLCSFGRSLLHFLCSWFPKFRGLLIAVETQEQRKLSLLKYVIDE